MERDVRRDLWLWKKEESELKLEYADCRLNDLKYSILHLFICEVEQDAAVEAARVKLAGIYSNPTPTESIDVAEAQIEYFVERQTLNDIRLEYLLLPGGADEINSLREKLRMRFEALEGFPTQLTPTLQVFEQLRSDIEDRDKDQSSIPPTPRGKNAGIRNRRLIT